MKAGLMKLVLVALFCWHYYVSAVLSSTETGTSSTLLLALLCRCSFVRH